MKKSYEMPLPQVRYLPEPELGLDDAAVEARFEEGLYNLPVEPPTKSVKQIILSNVFTYFNLIFMIIAAALIAVGSFKELLFMVVIAANTVIGIVQEIRSKKTLDKMALLTEPKTTAIRNGKPVKTANENLVLDDVILLSSGNQICCDAVLLDGEVTVNESAVTGESIEIKKKSGDTLVSGSFVVSGVCRARIEAVGYDSFVSRLTIEAKRSRKRQPAGMMRSLSNLVLVIGILIIPLGAAMIYLNSTVHMMSIKENVETAAPALIGMIPEGLFLLTTVALAVSVMRLAKKRTLVHELNCIEALARVDILCVDKTGTITENEMSLAEIVPLCSETPKNTETLIADYVCATDDDNITAAAIRAAIGNKASGRKAKKALPFKSSLKYGAVAFSQSECYTMGAPEFILGSDVKKYSKAMETFAKEGYRVLLFASCGGYGEDGRLLGIINPVCFILLYNNIRPEAAATFSYFAEQGVTIKVISGDNPVTVSAAAAKAGIPDSDKYIDTSTLSGDKELSAAALKYTVFGRVTPEEKRTLISAMKKARHTVAMTGDGVNDVLALKEADCSIAMASGSDVAAQASHLVLLDSDFSALPAVVAEGRRVINNIERTASLFLIKNIFSFLTALLTIAFAFEFPLTTNQMSLISSMTIGVPAFFLSLEPNKSLVTGKFLKNVLYTAMPAGLTDVIIAVVITLFGKAFPDYLPSDGISTMTMLLILFIGIMMLIRVCRPFNALRVSLVVAMSAGIILALTVMPQFFEAVPLSFGCWLIVGVMAALAIPLMHYMINLFVFVRNIFSKERRIKRKEAVK